MSQSSDGLAAGRQALETCARNLATAAARFDTMGPAIDLINGSELLREWVDDPGAAPNDFDALTKPDEEAWARERQPHLLY